MTVDEWTKGYIKGGEMGVFKELSVEELVDRLVGLNNQKRNIDNEIESIKRELWERVPVQEEAKVKRIEYGRKK